jgi:hypothetical protein
VFIPPNSILVGLSKDQLTIILLALEAWKGPCKGKPRHPTEEDYQKQKLKEAKNLRLALSEAVK